MIKYRFLGWFIGFIVACIFSQGAITIFNIHTLIGCMVIGFISGFVFTLLGMQFADQLFGEK